MSDFQRTEEAIRVVPVASRRDHGIFIRIPWSIYENDRNWVPPLITSENARWSRKRNATLAARQHWRFIAYRGDRPVGRIAASIDSVFAERWQPASGFFGFFEAEQDPKVGAALLSAAEIRLARAGCRTIIGPVNLSTQDEVGLLIKGFESSPKLLSPYNPPYYRDVLERCGYSHLRRYDSYLWAGSIEPNEALVRLCRDLERRASRLGLRIRQADDRNWKKEARRLHRLYNQCFPDVWGFTPITRAEFMQRTAQFRKFYRPDLVLIAEIEGRPVGFGIVLPDINRVLQRLDGRLFPFGFLTALKEAPNLRDGRFLLLGVLPQYEGIGLGALIAYRMDEVGRQAGFERVELSLIDSENVRIRRILDAVGCHLVKSYRLFSKDLQLPGRSDS